MPPSLRPNDEFVRAGDKLGGSSQAGLLRTCSVGSDSKETFFGVGSLRAHRLLHASGSAREHACLRVKPVPPGVVCRRSVFATAGGMRHCPKKQKTVRLLEPAAVFARTRGFFYVPSARVMESRTRVSRRVPSIAHTQSWAMSRYCNSLHFW